ncbi:MAG: hypothetical protein ACPG4W_08655 [Flavobacteriales bacterium]
MKLKHILILSLSLMISVLSCKKDNDNADDGTGGGDGGGASAKYIGDWECSGISASGDIMLGGVSVGSFTATGFDLSDFILNVKETPSSLLTEGNYSLMVDLNTLALPISDIAIEDQTLFPVGLYSVNDAETTMTVELTGGTVQDLTILENTETKLVLSLSQDIDFQTPAPISYDVTLDADLIFSFQAQ